MIGNSLKFIHIEEIFVLIKMYTQTLLLHSRLKMRLIARSGCQYCSILRIEPLIRLSRIMVNPQMPTRVSQSSKEPWWPLFEAYLAMIGAVIADPKMVNKPFYSAQMLTSTFQTLNQKFVFCEISPLFNIFFNDRLIY